MEIQAVIKSAVIKLKNVADSPALDAERLLLHVLNKQEPSWLIAHGHDNLSQYQLRKYKEMLEERAAGKPLAYILGQWDFYGRPFTVNEHVLIPRPETENLITKALSIIRKMRTNPIKPLTIADIGTGSGCIIISLALELINLKFEISIYKFIATDISSKALKIAKYNAKTHQVDDKIEFLAGNMLDPLQSKHIDLIVSNPPYVPSSELTKPPTKETLGLKFEPKLALDGGPDGQMFIKRIEQSGIPAVVEGVNGEIFAYNLPS